MRLVGCHIENFGKLHNYDIQFEGERSVILEENGWGKSTLASFIRVMLFGFCGDGKRSETDNERKRFKPWQTGVYGGSLTFETGGKRYRIERIFGDKKSGSDNFALYDADTNIKSDDYDSNVGETLFGIDRESFMKTVFIAQQDCSGGVTTGINAKIGNVADQTADLGNFDAVQQRLKKELDYLTPERATGQLSKLQAKISDLKEKVRNKEVLSENVRIRARELEELTALKEEKQGIQDALQRQMSKLSERKDILAEANAYQEIMEQESAARAEYEEKRKLFPKEVPGKKELESQLARIDEYENCLQTMRNYALTPQDTRILEENGKRFADGIPKDRLFDEMNDCYARYKKAVVDQTERKMTESERRRMKEAEAVFWNYRPSFKEIDRLSVDWSERKSKKESLSAKEASAQLLKNVYDQTVGTEMRKLKIGLVLIGGAILSVLMGTLLNKLMHLPGGLVFGGILGLILMGTGIYLRASARIQVKSASLDAYDKMECSIREDEVFIKRVEEDCREFFDKMGTSYDERDVSIQLARIRDNLKDYEELDEKNRLQGDAALEKSIAAMQSKLTGFLGKYGMVQRGKDMQELLFELKEKCTGYAHSKEKRDAFEKAKKQSEEIVQEIQEFLHAIGFEADGNEKNRLTGLRDACISLEALGANLSQKELRRKRFEEEHDISRITAGQEAGGEESMEEISSQFQKLQSEVEELTKTMRQFQEQIDGWSAELESVESQEALLEECLEKQEYCQRKYQIIRRTKEYLEMAKEHFSSKYVDIIQSSFEKYYDMISGSKEKYELDANLNIYLKAKGKLRDTQLLSEGYQDMVGLCRRMAMVDAMYGKEKPFLILDDPFVNLDESRLEGAKEFLNRLAETYQIIYFSCHESRC